MTMRILFACDEGERDTAIDTGEGASAPSLFFCSELPPRDQWRSYDAVVIGAMDLLADPPGPVASLVVASGPSSLASACFEAGCSDFIREPWTVSELVARVKARAGSVAGLRGGAAEFGESLGRPLARLAASLPEPSARLFSLLALNAPGAVPREAIAALFGLGGYRGRAVDMRVARLRVALRRAGVPAIAEAIRCSEGSYSLRLGNCAEMRTPGCG